ncbi:hypothetical protein AVEN_217898-1 [Araneus ventricosus]|uniref:Uncharacterized protein n=1 Tax=Araneus ventricosus TaxID=182803 RepID=A0A4Y2EIT4_ARAVE|nr:hypothetical protein AVEN_217898-1 [Araneus ventricosus]
MKVTFKRLYRHSKHKPVHKQFHQRNRYAGKHHAFAAVIDANANIIDFHSDRAADTSCRKRNLIDQAFPQKVTEAIYRQRFSGRGRNLWFCESVWVLRGRDLQSW